MLKKIVVFASLAHVAFAAVAPVEGKTEKIRTHSSGFVGTGGCYNLELNTVMPYGTTAPSKKFCWLYRCESYPIHPWFLSCPEVKAKPPCYVVEDKSKTYPGCCPVVRCNSIVDVVLLILDALTLIQFTH